MRILALLVFNTMIMAQSSLKSRSDDLTKVVASGIVARVALAALRLLGSAQRRNQPRTRVDKPACACYTTPRCYRRRLTPLPG